MMIIDKVNLCAKLRMKIVLFGFAVSGSFFNQNHWFSHDYPDFTCQSVTIRGSDIYLCQEKKQQLMTRNPADASEILGALFRKFAKKKELPKTK